ncbi:MAG: Trk system potassium uptake protein TrkG [Chlamydiia bacterium]|nr:Trk system potassium uptake protein TrkG [Chlamydiia bacterium]MCH9615660.1 Trk system potassium uptake protein TrkG [Chlamydiia bacterium]MCH9628937.1 Trk system potassium uptake protein TrkG [Chlamydiia bacterium]
MLLRQRIHFRPILCNLGLLLHVPGLMALISLIIAVIFHEWFAIIPFLVTGLGAILIGQLLYRCFYDEYNTHLWDAMIIAAVAWLICPLVAAVPLHWIGYILDIHPLMRFPDSLYEAFSGFTSTGLTMVTAPAEFPHTIQWWRSFTQWIGGIGLIVFVLGLTAPGKHEYRLYYAEARTENIGNNLRHTAQIIWTIYSIYTVLSCLAFIIAGMPVWAAINHAMAGISTGGFTITNDSFASYSTTIKWIGILTMLFGAISFAFHYVIFRKGRFKEVWRNKQHLWFFCLFVLGCGVGPLYHDPFVDTLFQWVSCLATCGFSTKSIFYYQPSFKIFLMLAMLIGGVAGSTAGGIKVHRFRYLFSGIYMRLKTITQEKEQFILAKRKEEPPGVYLPGGERAMRLFSAFIVLNLWLFCIFLGWFVLMHYLDERVSINALFDVFSALGNVGLGSGLMNPDFPTGGKVTFIFLMWLGRLEILPVLIIIFSFFTSRKEENE